MREAKRRWAAYIEADDRLKELQREFLAALLAGDQGRAAELSPVGHSRLLIVQAAYQRFVDWEGAHPEELAEAERLELEAEARRRGIEAEANSQLIYLAVTPSGPASAGRPHPAN